MTITELEFMQRFIRMCSDGWEQGWHERNGGNLSYRMREEDIAASKAFFKETPGGWVALGIQADNLKNAYFLVTGSGRYMRNMALAPQDNACIVEINDAGDCYRIVYGLEKGGRPTSELPSHLLNHSVRMTATHGMNRLIYHAHPANLIALTYVIPLTNRDFSRVLWKSATECPVVFPGGVGVVPWMVPGGSAIALASSELMKEFDAIVWAHHGLFVSGPDCDTTFGLMHTIEKAAQIYVLAMSMGQGIRQTIQDDDLRAIARDFGVTIREEFLD